VDVDSAVETEIQRQEEISHDDEDEDVSKQQQHSAVVVRY